MSRRGVSQQHRWPTWGWAVLAVFAALSFSACIDDVVIPECFLKGTCPEAGAGGDAEHPGSGTGGDLVDGGTGAEAPAAGQGGQAEPGPDTCSTCAVLPQHLTPACAGKPYWAALNVEGGLAPYSWRLAPQPKGWTIAVSPDDPESAVLRVSAAPVETTELTVVVTDARGQHLSLTLALEVRDNCWFAYSTVASEVPELWLVDPVADDPQPAPLAHQQGVHDFQFSPDGAFLAYRYGQDTEHPQGRHLSLVDLASLKEHDVGFGEDQVVYYAWAPSSHVLAAAFEKDDKRYLGAAVPAVPGSDDSPTSLISTAAAVDSVLYWVGSDYVAFHSLVSAAAPVRTTYTSRFSSGGFATPVDIQRHVSAGAPIQTTATGFFLITPINTIYRDLSGAVANDIDHQAIALVSPSGQYTAVLNPSGVPQLSAAAAGAGDIIEASDAAPTCTQLLAWAADKERLACVADVSNGDGSKHGEIRIFDLRSDATGLDATTLQGFCPGDVDDTSGESCLVKRQGYSFGSVQAAGVGRSFSASGRYFAFVRVVSQLAYVYVADLDKPSPSVAEPIVFAIAGTDPTPLGFLFAPDERFLLFRRGSRLWVIELETRRTGLVSKPLAVATPCSESFSAEPGAYCGNAQPLGLAQWAPDSRSFAYRTANGLTMVDLSPFPSKDVKVLPAAECAAQCAGQFGFQP